MYYPFGTIYARTASDRLDLDAPVSIWSVSGVGDSFIRKCVEFHDAYVRNFGLVAWYGFRTLRFYTALYETLYPIVP